MFEAAYQLQCVQVHLCICVYQYARICVCVCVHACACVCIHKEVTLDSKQSKSIYMQIEFWLNGLEFLTG